MLQLRRRFRAMTDEAQEIVGDGQVIHLSDGPHRVWLPSVTPTLLGTMIDLASETLFLEVDLQEKRAVFTDATSHLRVKGAFVEVLAAYAHQRCLEPWPDGGWLDSMDALEAWVKGGGNPESKAARVSWERSKLRSALVLQGALKVDAIFERRREGSTWVHRLSIPAERIVLQETG